MNDRASLSREAGRASGLALARALVLGLVALLAFTTSPAATDAAPLATLDLTRAEDLGAVAGTWRYHDASLEPVAFRAAGADGQPGTTPSEGVAIAPAAGRADFDDASWPIVPPSELAARRGPGKVSFGWYRLAFTIPERIGDVSVAGRALDMEISVDDYAEIWVDGELVRCDGQEGGSVVAGWNARHRVTLTRNARPGRVVRVAVFAINGPISASPTNYVFLRTARVVLVPGDAQPRALVPACEVNISVERFDPALDALVSWNPKLYKIADGFTFTEGPVWAPEDGGALLFSDPNENRIYRVDRQGRLAVWREQSGYDGADIGRYKQPGSNGLALDRDGRIIAAQHGKRRIVRIEPSGAETVLADRYQGKRLNSPNDVVVAQDGDVYFTDPPFGLPGFDQDPSKELEGSGVYRLSGTRLTLIDGSLAGPNGIALSPDENTLYVGNWDPRRKVVMRYARQADGAFGKGSVLIDLTNAPGYENSPEAIDGVKVDELGHVYIAGPGGLWIVAPDGRPLGLVRAPRPVHNLAWAEDGHALYLAAEDGLYRMPLRVRGYAPHLVARPRLERSDAAFDAIVPPDARVVRVAAGFRWLEGPAWDARTGYLYFSDIPANAIYRVKPGSRPERHLAPAGYSGETPFAGREPGSNGLAFDREGRLVVCEHGDRRVTRVSGDGSKSVVADRFEGRRLNSPNDVVVAKDGALWFTDPPFGLPGAFEDEARELAWSGVYRALPAEKGGARLTLLTREVRAPNGLALARDERTLFVSNADRSAPHVLAFPIANDGTLGTASVFFDATPWLAHGGGAPDGIELDRDGNVFVAGPGGVHVLSPAGRHLGLIAFGVPVANLEWGEDGRTLFIVADSTIWSVRTRTGAAFP